MSEEVKEIYRLINTLNINENEELLDFSSLISTILDEKFQVPLLIRKELLNLVINIKRRKL